MTAFHWPAREVSTFACWVWISDKSLKSSSLVYAVSTLACCFSMHSWNSEARATITWKKWDKSEYFKSQLSFSVAYCGCKAGVTATWHWCLGSHHRTVMKPTADDRKGQKLHPKGNSSKREDLRDKVEEINGTVWPRGASQRLTSPLTPGRSA